MASPTSPTHGKLGAIYLYRPNGFKGNGLNNATWGLVATNAATAYYEVVIDGVGTGIGGVDEFKWRKNGGAWTENVDISGAAQTLDEAQTITFATTTGHTLTDQWFIGNLVAEPCTESGTQGQITEATRRRINPNSTVTFTDSGGATLQIIDYTRGIGHFSANVGVTVTAAGNNGFVLDAALEKVGYLIDWSVTIALDMSDASSQGDNWKKAYPGQANCNGNANAYMIGGDSFLHALKDTAEAGTEKYYLLELFNYDPDADQTGDHFVCWATISGFSPNAALNEVVKEPVTFQTEGIPSFISNV